MAPMTVEDLKRLTTAPDIPIDPPTAARARAKGIVEALDAAIELPNTDSGDEQAFELYVLSARIAEKVIADLTDDRIVMPVVTAYSEDCVKPECRGSASRDTLHSQPGVVSLVTCDECGTRFLMDPGHLLGT